MNDLQAASTAPTLLRIQPVVNARHALAALHIVLPSPTTPETLLQRFSNPSLNEALGDLPCIVSCDIQEALTESVTTQLLANFPAERLLILLAAGSDASTKHWQCLQSHGVRLISQAPLTHSANTAPSKTEDPYHINSFAIHADAIASHNSEISTLLRAHSGKHLALDVSTPAAFMQAMMIGCTWFTGNYPYYPSQSHEEQGPSRVILLKLLTLIAQQAENHAIEEALKQSPELSYQLLKLVNSVSFGLTRKIANFGHALAMLGRNQLQRWLQLVLYAQPQNEMPNPLLLRAVFRASLMETLCKTQGGSRDLQEQAFMIGMFSLLHFLLGLPLENILKPLNLTPEICAALLQRTGPLGELLHLIESSEIEAQNDLSEQLTATGLTAKQLYAAQIQAIGWARQVTQAL